MYRQCWSPKRRVPRAIISRIRPDLRQDTGLLNNRDQHRSPFRTRYRQRDPIRFASRMASRLLSSRVIGRTNVSDRKVAVGRRSCITGCLTAGRRQPHGLIGIARPPGTPLLLAALKVFPQRPRRPFPPSLRLPLRLTHPVAPLFLTLSPALNDQWHQGCPSPLYQAAFLRNHHASRNPRQALPSFKSDQTQENRTIRLALPENLWQ